MREQIINSQKSPNQNRLPTSTIIVVSTLLLFGGASITWFAFQLFKPDPKSYPPITSGTLNISITETGFHTIKSADIQANSDLKLGLWEQQPVALTEQGKSVPFLIQEGQLIFFGREQDSIYSNKRVYQLHFGESAVGKGETFKRFSATPNALEPAQATINRIVHLEQDDRYVSIARSDQSQNTWYWDQIHVNDWFETTADLPHIADGSATLTAHLLGISYDAQTEDDHDLDLVINGIPVTEIVWDGENHFYPQISLPPNTLKDGNNEIILDNRPEGNTFIDISELDWLSLTYSADPTAENDHIHFKTEATTLALDRFSQAPLVLAFFKDGSAKLATEIDFNQGTARLTVPQSAEIYATAAEGFHTPAQIQAVPTVEKTANNALNSVTPQADMIIITDNELAPELGPLVEARENQGLAVTVATVEEIYNDFGYGQPSPFAVQAYLADARENWATPAPRYLLLAGSTTYDYRNNLNGSRQNRVPSMLVGVTHSGETISDTQLADVDGDGRADFAVGRWPVTSRDELASLVRRTLAYEQAQVSEQVLFTADGTAPDFGYTADRLISSGGLDSLNPTRAYGASWEAVTDAWNDGNWIVTYVGHGSVDLWGSKEVLSSERVAGLETPVDIAPPIVLQFTCLTGFFAHPEQPSISEEMLLNDDGPVLVVSATSLTYSSSQEPFANGILSRLADPTVIRMGDVLSQARSELDISNPNIKEVHDTFVLLGDPSTIIGRPSQFADLASK